LKPVKPVPNAVRPTAMRGTWVLKPKWLADTKVHPRSQPPRWRRDALEKPTLNTGRPSNPSGHQP
jgi:hypothetical protein